jgi:hypothetical protein
MYRYYRPYRFHFKNKQKKQTQSVLKSTKLQVIQSLELFPGNCDDVGRSEASGGCRTASG